MIPLILKILSAVFSSEFEVILREIKENRRRAISSSIEKAKEKAQAEHDTRDLQKKLGRLTE